MSDFILDNLGIVVFVGYILLIVFKSVFAKNSEDGSPEGNLPPSRRAEREGGREHVEKSLYERRTDNSAAEDAEAARNMVEQMKRRAAAEQISQAESSDFESAQTARSFEEDFDAPKKESRADTWNVPESEEFENLEEVEEPIEIPEPVEVFGSGEFRVKVPQQSAFDTVEIESRLAHIYAQLEDIKTASSSANVDAKSADTFSERSAYAAPAAAVAFKFNGGTLSEAIVASEIIAPPLALRGERQTIL